MNAADFNRWIEMDRLLFQGCLHVPRFAKKCRISERRVRADLAFFRKRLGQVTREPEFIDEIREYWQGYAKGVKPLFTRNL